MENTLPKNWVQTELGIISEIVTGNTPSKSNSEYYGDEILWVKPGDFHNQKYIENTDEMLSLLGFSKARRIPKNSILVTCIGNLGNIAIASKELSTNQQINSIVIKHDKLVEKYVYYYSLTLKKWLTENSTSTTISMVNKSVFETAPIKLPPLAEQERIVAKLDVLFAQHEAMKKALQRIPQLLKDFRQQVLTQAVTGKLTEEWRKGKELEGWKIDVIKNLASKLGSGSTPRGGSDTYLSEGVPLVRSMNIVFGGIKLNGLAFINEFQANALKNVEIQFEDILLNITGASIGRLCLANEIVTGGRVNQHVFIIRAKVEIVLSKYLEIYLRSNLIQRFIEEKKYGAGMEAISKTQIENFEINLPPLEEQQEIVTRVESLFTKADSIESRYQTLKEKIEALPQALLHKAFKGELVPQLPTDGDAKDLLAEILQLKEATKPKKGKK